eukprot:scaffold84901_cov72-Phaeocystis_antarctica.AAC.3
MRWLERRMRAVSVCDASYRHDAHAQGSSYHKASTAGEDSATESAALLPQWPCFRFGRFIFWS